MHCEYAMNVKDLEETYEFYQIYCSWYTRFETHCVWSIKSVDLLQEVKDMHINKEIYGFYKMTTHEKTYKIHVPFALYKPMKCLVDDNSFKPITISDQWYQRQIRDRMNGRDNNTKYIPLNDRYVYVYYFRATDNDKELLNLDYSLRTDLGNRSWQGTYPIFKNFELASRYCSEINEYVDFYVQTKAGKVAGLAYDTLLNMDALMKIYSRYVT